MKHQTSHTRHSLAALLLSSFLLLPLPRSYADLTATVTPGKQFTSGERPTVATLNLLGTPTITITGTVGGTNAGIGAATINGTMLVDTFVDGTNITWNTASPRRLKIVDGGVGVTQISANIAGFGLLGGGGSALRVFVDTNSITFSPTNSDVLTLGTNLTPAYFRWTTNTLVGGSGYFTNAPITLPSGWYITNNALVAPSQKYSGTNAMPAAAGSCTFTHGLGQVPTIVNLSLICTNANAATGMSPGDQIPMTDVRYSSEPFYVTTVSSTAVTVRVNNNSGSAIYMLNKSTGNFVSSGSSATRNDFIIRLDAAYLP
mgnify:CR=1 FL=1